jgi:predicted SprT family Zn-dependent metalloprotease
MRFLSSGGALAYQKEANKMIFLENDVNLPQIRSRLLSQIPHRFALFLCYHQLSQFQFKGEEYMNIIKKANGLPALEETFCVSSLGIEMPVVSVNYCHHPSVPLENLSKALVLHELDPL